MNKKMEINEGRQRGNKRKCKEKKRNVRKMRQKCVHEMCAMRSGGFDDGVDEVW